MAFSPYSKGNAEAGIMDVVPTPLESPKDVKVGLRNLKDATRMNGVTEDTLSSVLMLVDNMI